MISPTPEHYIQALYDVEKNWEIERLLQDFRTANGNSGLTKAQADHLRALLAWSDLKTTGKLERGDRYTSPSKVIAQLLSIEEKSAKTEISRSITPCIKQLLNFKPGKRVRIDAIPDWLKEQGYRQATLIPSSLGAVQRERSPIPEKATKSNRNTPEKYNISNPNSDRIVPLYTKRLAILPTFYGRETQLKQLDTLLYSRGSRLIVVYGRGGVGKTCLVNKWLESVQANFSHVIWRQVWDRPSLTQLVWDIMQRLPNYTKAEMPDSADQQISWLLSALCTHKCLIILDDIHNLFHIKSNQSPDTLSFDTTEPRCYEVLFEQLATNQDFQQSESFVIGIGWYRPSILARIKGPRSPILDLEIPGLEFDDARHILAEYDLINDQKSWRDLVGKYRGVPYSLKLVGTHICQIYGGNITEFMSDETMFLGDAESLIHQQFQCIRDISKSQRIADICQLVCLILSKEGGCTSVSDLRRQLNQHYQLGLSVSDVGRSLQTLYEMKLIEKKGDRFSSPPDITKYTLQRYQIYLPQLIKRLKLPELG